MSDTKQQVRLRPVIRVFVSSTFSDMKHERNALEADAFPKLEQLCQRQGFQFQAIDLRWGVSTEAGLDHRTMRICFDELRRAREISPRPNFLILLGNRYGWRPLLEEISVEEFHRLEHAAVQIPGSGDKSAVAVLREWYREDTNAIPPVYLLESRRQDLGDDQDYTHDAVWNQVQAVLWTIINWTMPPEQLQRRFDVVASDGSPPTIVRFQTSATEQEIWHGALRVPDAREHVLAFFREIENLAAFSDPKQIKDFVDVNPSGRVEVALQTEVDRLKAELGQRLGSANVFRNEAPVRLVEAQDNQGRRTVDVTTDHLAQLCADVVSRLSEIIQGQIDEYWRNTAQASTDRTARELEIEQLEYERFAEERGGEDSFVGRQVELQAILDYMESNSRWPLAIHGASGCGKTALLARASQEVAKTQKRIERFIGVAPRSSDLRSLLSSLCQELRRRNPRADALPTEIKQLCDEFSQHLQAATPEQPLILFLDALDQLAAADNGRLLNWLPPGSLPAHVKLVVSCLSDRAPSDPAGQPYVELKRRQIPVENFISLHVLSEAEARLLIFDRWLPNAGRKVSDDQRARIEQRLAFPTCRHPIYLKLLFEEVQLWHSYDPSPMPGESVPALLGQLLERLSLDTNHGPLLVNRVLGYLSASRHGLAESEILEILFADPEYRTKLNEATEQTRHELPSNAKRIPIALWSRLRFDLSPYLTERAAPGANVLTFYHRQVGEWVRDRFGLAGERPRETREPTVQPWHPHPRLADYFTACAKGTDPHKEWETDSVRGFAKCVYHFTKSEQTDQAAVLLTNFPFLLHKLRVGLLEGVFEDYAIVRREAPAEVVKRLEIWANFFLEKAHILRRGNGDWPTYKILLQLSVEHADDSPLTTCAEQWLAKGCCDWLWLCRVPRLPHPQKHPCLLVLEGHSHGVNGALILADDRILSWSFDKTLRLWDSFNGACLAVLKGHSDNVTGALALAGGRLLSWAGGYKSADHTLRLWDGNATCLAVFEGHVGGVLGVLALEGGRVLSWSYDTTLRVWDETNGACLTVLERHAGEVSGALPISGDRLLSWSTDKTLCLWDSRKGRCLNQLVGHTDKVNGAFVLQDGRLLSWSDDHTLRIWDCDTGKCLKVLKGHDREINGALELSDSRLLSWSWDKSLRIWNSITGDCLAILEVRPHDVLRTLEVLGALVMPDGRVLSWGSEALRFWDSRTGECLKVLQGHPDGNSGATLLKSGQILSWSFDLRLWDGRTGECLIILDDHAGGVNGALAFSDGRVLSWSDDKTLRVWDGMSRAPCEMLEGHKLDVYGLLALADGRFLSCSKDNTLRIWDNESGCCLVELTGHGSLVMGALELDHGKVVSWSFDTTLRLWNTDTGKCIRIFEGHRAQVLGAIALKDGRLLSWSDDKNLRLWDTANGRCLAVFVGHTSSVWGALALDDGTILSWALDNTLRLWNSYGGVCLAVLEDHAGGVLGASVLASGQIISWSGDGTLRLWKSGKSIRFVSIRVIWMSWRVILALLQGPRRFACQAVFEGHTEAIEGAVILNNNQILSWSDDETWRLWDIVNGMCLETISESEVANRLPKWSYARANVQNRGSVTGDFFVEVSGRSAYLRHKLSSSYSTHWSANSDVGGRCSPCVVPNGTVVVAQRNGQVCVLKLRHGSRRISLAEAEDLLQTKERNAPPPRKPS